MYKSWADILIKEIDKIIEEHNLDRDIWIDTGSRCDVAVAKLKCIEEQLTQAKLPWWKKILK